MHSCCNRSSTAAEVQPSPASHFWPDLSRGLRILVGNRWGVLVAWGKSCHLEDEWSHWEKSIQGDWSMFENDLVRDRSIQSWQLPSTHQQGTERPSAPVHLGGKSRKVVQTSPFSLMI